MCDVAEGGIEVAGSVARTVVGANLADDPTTEPDKANGHRIHLWVHRDRDNVFARADNRAGALAHQTGDRFPVESCFARHLRPR